jgi:antitoxin (DNA-binding transcriptional repressor) of toxin-antitoxin stability system
MKKFTVEEFQSDFDNLLSRVEKGEHIGIIDENEKAVVVIPADDDLIRIHTELNNEAP